MQLIPKKMALAAVEGDFRVSNSGDQEVTMMDTREKGRPPGEPPDGPTSWVKKVTGSGGGGIRSPEEVLDEDFVMDRLSLEFPNGEDGEPVITIGREVIDAMNGLWKKCIIAKVLGRNVSVSVLSRKLKELWKPVGAMSVMDLPRQFFMIRFALEEEYMGALTGEPWRVFGSYLLVQAWAPEFDPLRDEIATTPVWIRLSNLPVTFYHKAILMGIAKGLGNSVKVDLTTLKFERARFARVCVEVNLKRPLKVTVMVNGERYYVSYEGLNTICSKCGMYGHLVHTCPQANLDKVVTETQPPAEASVNGSTPANDGFTLVRRSGKKPVNAVEKITYPAANPRRNLRKIPINKVFHNIAITNRFSGLEEEEITTANKGNSVIMGANKGNNKSQDSRNKVSSIAQVKEGSFETVVAKEKWAGTGKPSKTNGPKVDGPKIKHRPIKPMRGLVFGQTGEDITLSTSGKRVRIEKEGTGRSGGVFFTGVKET